MKIISMICVGFLFLFTSFFNTSFAKPFVELPEKLLNYKFGDGPLSIDKFSPSKNLTIHKYYLDTKQVTNGDKVDITLTFNVGLFEFPDYQSGPLSIEFEITGADKKLWETILQDTKSIFHAKNVTKQTFVDMFAQLSNNFERLSSLGMKMNLKKFQFKAPDFILDFTITSNLKPNEGHEFTIGDSTIHIIEFKTLTQSPNVGFKNLVVTSSNNINNNLLSSTIDTTLDKLTIGQYTYGPGKLNIAINNIDANILDWFIEKSHQFDQVDKMDREKQMKFVMELQEKFLVFTSNDIQIIVSPSYLKTPEDGEITLTGSLKIEKPEKPFTNIYQVQKALLIDFKISAPQPLVKSSMTGYALTNVERKARYSKNTENMTEKQKLEYAARLSDKFLSQLLKQKVIIEEDNNYVTHIVYKDQNMSVNGRALNEHQKIHSAYDKQLTVTNNEKLTDLVKRISTPNHLDKQKLAERTARFEDMLHFLATYRVSVSACIQAHKSLTDCSSGKFHIPEFNTQSKLGSELVDDITVVNGVITLIPKKNELLNIDVSDTIVATPMINQHWQINWTYTGGAFK